MPGAGPFDVPGDYYLRLPGGAASNATTPDITAYDVTDLDIRAEITPDSWKPGGNYEIGAKWLSATGNRSFRFLLMGYGGLGLQWSNDGTATPFRQSTQIIAPPAKLWVRATLDVNNGAAGNDVAFYTSPDGSSWTQLGVTETQAGTTSIFASSAILEVGNINSGTGTFPFRGRIHRFELRNGIAGSIVAQPNFSAQVSGVTSFTDASSRVWTVNSPASIDGSNYESIPDDRIKSLHWSTGRDNELDQFRSGSATIVLRNNDRRYDPEHTTGPHFGALLPRAPFRIQLSTDGISWQDQFYGFVKGGWQQAYFKPKVSTCTVELEDLLGVLESEDLPGSAWEAEVLENGPLAFWRLDERSGTQMADSSGNANHGFIDNGTLGEEPLVLGDGSAFTVPHVGDNRGRYKGGGLPVGEPCTLLAWIKTPRDLGALKSIIVVQRDSALGSGIFFCIEESAFGSPNGELVINFLFLGSFYKARGHTRCDDDQPHMVVCTIDGNTAADVELYVDGILQTKTLLTGTNPGPWASHLIWTVGNTVDSNSGDFGLDGIVDEVAVFDSALTAQQITDLYAAGSTGFGAETSGARVDRVLDLVGLPVALRDIATGDTTVGSADYQRRSVASYLQGVVESEQGVLYVNHNASGKLTFRGRYDRLTATRSTTSQASFTGSHFREDVVPEPNGIETVVNVAEVAWQGGTEVVTDEPSKTQYGAQRRSLATEAPTPSAAQSAGGWLVARYKDPQTRLRRLPFNLAGKPELWDTILDLQISDRTTVTRHPQKVGAQIVNSLILEGTDFTLAEDLSWTVDFRLSNADDATVWIWGTSTWGETTSWG
jgi:hypothetical protein